MPLSQEESINGKYLCVIINVLVKSGNIAKEAEELIMTFMKEQRALDELRDNLHGLISE